MEKLQVVASPKPVVVSSASDSASVALAKRIEQAIRRGSAGRIHKLRVDVQHGKIVLNGFCSTFYAKQLAQHSAMPLMEGRRIENQIEVW